MTTKEKKYARARERYAEKKRGVEHYIPVDHPDAVAARNHLALCKLSGMTVDRIAELGGVSASSVCQFLRGTRSRSGVWEPVTHVHAETAEIYRAIPVEEAPPKGGALMDPTGTRRRLQGLFYEGFSIRTLAREHGGTTYQRLHVEMTNSRDGKFVRACTVREIKALADRLSGKDPRDFGGRPEDITRTRNAARRHDYAPLICWDDDTIDDPDAIPEWTGRCGTNAGYQAHKKLGTRFLVPTASGGYKESPGCYACREAEYAHRKGGVERQNWGNGAHGPVSEETALIVKRLVAGDTPTQIAEAMGVKRFKVYNIRRTVRAGGYAALTEGVTDV